MDQVRFYCPTCIIQTYFFLTEVVVLREIPGTEARNLKITYVHLTDVRAVVSCRKTLPRAFYQSSILSSVTK